MRHDEGTARHGSALVTGAGGGLGATIARRLATDGWPVIVNDLRPDAAEAVAERIRDLGGRAVGIAADATAEQAVADLVRRGAERFGPVLVSVANASGPQGPVPLAELTWADVSRHLDFFARSPLAIVQAVRPGMAAAGWGRVIHIGSDLFDRGDPGWSPYMAAKGAMVGLTRGWAQELGGEGITVNLVEPGWIPVGRHGDIDDGVRDAWWARQAVPRWGVPDDVAGAVSYLASDDAGFVAGQRIVVNGGFRHL